MMLANVTSLDQMTTGDASLEMKALLGFTWLELAPWEWTLIRLLLLIQK